IIITASTFNSILSTFSLHDALPILNFRPDQGCHCAFPRRCRRVLSKEESLFGSCGLGIIQQLHADDVEAGVDIMDFAGHAAGQRSEEHTSELQSRENIVCRSLLEKK